jgi:hypothetical protein
VEVFKILITTQSYSGQGAAVHTIVESFRNEKDATMAIDLINKSGIAAKGYSISQSAIALF